MGGPASGLHDVLSLLRNCRSPHFDKSLVHLRVRTLRIQLEADSRNYTSKEI